MLMVFCYSDSIHSDDMTVSLSTMMGTLKNVSTDGGNMDDAIERLHNMISENIDEEFDPDPSFGVNVDELVEDLKEEGERKLRAEIQQM